MNLKFREAFKLVTFGRFIRNATLVGAISIFPSYSYALDQCKDVLKDGAYKLFSDKSNYYFKMIRDFEFSKKTFEEAKRDMSFGGDVPIGDLVLGANFTQAQFEQKKLEINKRFSTNITMAKILDISLISGDPVIVGAWSDCMNRKGGLALTYEVDNSLSVRAKLQWFTPPESGQGSVTLSDDISLPSVVDVEQSSLKCFKKGRVLTANTNCTAVLRLKDATSSMTLLAQAQHNENAVGDAAAYLPPRLRPVEEKKPFDFNISDECKNFRSSTVFVKNNVINQYQQCNLGNLTAEGWVFDQSSLRVVQTDKGNPGRGSHCGLEVDPVSPYHVGYKNAAYSAVAGTQVCEVTASVNIRREQWLPY